MSKYLTLHQEINHWYKKHGRLDLPWRMTTDPYEIYLSEIMLQQTQVATVLNRFYFQFLQKFPSLVHLAQAHEDEVLKAWEGLGYYTRARNLHKTAQMVQTTLPNSAVELQKLPGIGKSTAHAVAVFAFGESLPILDANVKRIVYRFFAQEKCNDKQLWNCAYELYDRQNAYDYNQALMDIGSSICTAKNPKCTQCPFQSLCQGQDDPLRYPTKKIKKTKPTRHRVIVVYKNAQKFHVQQNQDKRLLNGLWGFEQIEKKDFKAKKSDIILSKVVHHYSHFKLDAEVVLRKSRSIKRQWFSIDQINALALSGADRKVLELIRF
ncbi:MAG: A/G-specific adenine glycosylase [Campylobacterota bacterium]|nr:A/G-specific adenine glycosylase [Campylobacterota bacterium]